MTPVNIVSELQDDGTSPAGLKPIRIPIPCQSYYAVFSPDETRVAVVSQDGKVRIFGLPKGELQRTSNVPGGNVSDLLFSGDGRRLLAGGVEGGAIIWNTVTGESEWEYRFPGSHHLSVGFSLDGRLIALAPEAGDPRVFDWKSKRELAHLDDPVTGATALTFSANGQKIAAASGETMIRIFDPQTGKLLAENRDFLLETFVLAFSPDSRVLFAGNADGAISILDSETGKLLRSFPKRSGESVYGMQVRSDGEAVLAVYINALDPQKPTPICVWDVKTATVTQTWEPGEIPVGAMWTRTNEPLVASSTASTLRIERLS
jgi:WD40 repeat protein